MKDELHIVLSDIELIISRIAAFDSAQFKLSYEERQRLTQLFHRKLHQAKTIKSKKITGLAS